MEFGRAFTYAFEDSDWLKKIGIAALVSLIPLIGLITLLGWALEITRRVIHREAELLPAWDNFGDFVSNGFKAFLVGFVYALPIILISGCLNTVLPLLTSAAGDNGGSVISTVVTVVSICFGCFNFILSIMICLVVPAALGNLAASGGNLSAGFRFNEIFGLLRAAPGPYALVLLGGLVSSFIAGLGLIACLIGIVFTQALAMSINAHLWGQAYQAAKGLQDSSSAA